MDNTNNNAEVFCANCGAKMPAGTKFCISCGKPVGGPAAPNPNMTQQTAYATQAAPMPKIDLITNLIDIFRTCLFLVLGVNALKMRDVSIGFIDNMINRNL